MNQMQQEQNRLDRVMQKSSDLRKRFRDTKKREGLSDSLRISKKRSSSTSRADIPSDYIHRDVSSNASSSITALSHSGKFDLLDPKLYRFVQALLHVLLLTFIHQ